MIANDRIEKKIRFIFHCSSPDSEDSYDDEDDCTDDNQRLVSDKRDKKHYGTTLHKITPVPKTIEEKMNEKMDNVKKRLQVGKLFLANVVAPVNIFLHRFIKYKQRKKIYKDYFYTWSHKYSWAQLGQKAAVVS